MEMFTGKQFVVTGGAQGIGKAIARRLLEQGARVLAADSDREAGEQAAAEFQEFGDFVYMETDVSSEQSVEQLFRGLDALDGLINNAGIGAGAPLEEYSLDDWNRVIGVNLTGCFLCAKHAAPLLRKSRGSIVNIASTRWLQSGPNTFAYTASKGGIVALTHALAVSLGPAVRANCISPGWIEVSEWKKASQRRAPELTPEDHAQHPAGRVGKPEDIAALTAFLLSKEAEFITGQNHVVDGGMTRKMIYEE